MLLKAVERIGKENIYVLPVDSKRNVKIIRILSYRDIIATYKYGIDEHEKKQPHISLKRNGLKILKRGRGIVLTMKRRDK